jgi:hypothetical protein
MKRRHLVLLGSIATCVTAAVLSAFPARSEPPPSARTLEEDVPGAEKSPVPTAKEWLTAKPVKLSRTSKAAAGCVATRVREWLRVRCPVETFAISLLGGSSEALSFWIGPEQEGQPGEVQLPLRRGDRRVVQLWTKRKEADGTVVPQPSLVLQEQWVEGDPSPTVTVL